MNTALVVRFCARERTAAIYLEPIGQSLRTGIGLDRACSELQQTNFLLIRLIWALEKGG